MARLYSNENFPLPVVKALRALGHAVQTTRDAGKDGLAVPDAEVLAHAAREGRILLTLNRQDFKKLHRQNPAHAGIGRTRRGSRRRSIPEPRRRSGSFPTATASGSGCA